MILTASHFYSWSTAVRGLNLEEDRRVERLTFRTLKGSNLVASQPSSIFHMAEGSELESQSLPISSVSNRL